MKSLVTILLSIGFLLTIQACGDDETTDRSADTQMEEGLTGFELEHGIGPITERIEIDEEINEELLTKGRNIYEMKCEMCHNMEGRMVGPELGTVLERRSPEFVMNFILNPGRMAQDHPEGQKMLREYFTVMPFQNVKEDEARAILEFLRNYEESN